MKGIVRFFVVVMQRYLPDPLIFALLLTFVTVISALALTSSGLMDLINMWGNGLWGILGFAMQMALIVICGSAMAQSKPFRAFLGSWAGLAKNNQQAAMLCCVTCLICSFINWGFGLVATALVARELARRVPRMDYGYVVGCGYSGYVIWHMGLSGSIPLAIATPGHIVEKLIGLIPTSQTIFSSWNLLTYGLIFVTLPILCKMMAPADNEIKIADPTLLEDAPEIPEPVNKTPAEKLEYSRTITYILCAMGFAYLGYYFYTKGFELTLNIVIFVFLIVGMLLHRTPISYMRAANEAASSVGGIAIQFPLYGGIQGILINSGLAALIAKGFISISTVKTFPLLTFLSAGIVNIFVPSGGGQWIVQGPVNIPAALEIGANPAVVAMAIAWGDSWTNLIQPFWALPLLAVAKLGIRDIMGYCVLSLIWSGIVMCFGMYFLT